MWVSRGVAQNVRRRRCRTGATAGAALPAIAAGSVPSVAKSQAAPTAVVEPTLPGMPPAQGEEVDRVVAIVNGQLDPGQRRGSGADGLRRCCVCAEGGV